MLVEIVLGIVVIVGLAIVIMPRLLNRFIEGRVLAEMKSAHTLVSNHADPVLANLNPSRPALIYFTADWCAPCRTQQTPIIESLVAQYGDALQVRKIDVEHNPESAQSWGVQSLPRTFVLRPGLTIHTTNIGVASQQKLVDQINDAQIAEDDAPILVSREISSKSRGFKLGGFKLGGFKLGSDEDTSPH